MLQRIIEKIYRALSKAVNSDKGFTLIELIMVIVILGVLGGVAIGKFGDLKERAKQAKVDSMAEALETAGKANYACGDGAGDNCTALTNCTDLSTLLEGDALPTGWSITANALSASTGVVDCEINNDETTPKTATFKGFPNQL